jgi:hypothetical protein
MRHLLAFIILGMFCKAQGQISFSSKTTTTTTETKRGFHSEFNYKVGVSYQKSLTPELGIIYNTFRYKYKKETFAGTKYNSQVFGPYLAVELPINTSKTIVGPKIGFDFTKTNSFVSMTCGMELIRYTDYTVHNYTFSPRVGLSVGFIDFFYGYNFLSNHQFDSYIGHHKVGLSVTAKRLHWKKQKRIIIDGAEKG